MKSNKPHPYKHFIEPDDFEFIKNYKVSAKISYADFIDSAIKEKIERIKLENAIRDIKYNK